MTTDLGHDLLRFWQLSPGSGLAELGSVVLPLGSGPRHFARSSRGIVYVITEYSVEVAMLRPAPPAAGKVPLEFQGMFPVSSNGARPGDAAAEICVGADERHLYAGVRGSNRICTLRVGADGMPAPLEERDCGGVWPRHHCVDEGRLVVALERSSAIATFELSADGRLSGDPRRLQAGSPTCVLPHR